MKNVKPELIVGGTREGAGMTNATLLTMWADLQMARKTPLPDVMFVFLHNESTAQQTLKRLACLVGEEAVTEMAAHFAPRLVIPDIMVDAENLAGWLQSIEQTLPATRQLWVYADLYRTFRLGCTTGAGMVVPFSVEVTDKLADALNHEQVRLRCVSMCTRLGE